MANIVVEVPEGQFCGDKNWLTCMYDEAHAGEHRCRLFQVLSLFITGLLESLQNYL